MQLLSIVSSLVSVAILNGGAEFRHRVWLVRTGNLGNLENHRPKVVLRQFGPTPP